jgi:hypothetical protein
MHSMQFIAQSLAPNAALDLPFRLLEQQESEFLAQPDAKNWFAGAKTFHSRLPRKPFPAWQQGLRRALSTPPLCSLAVRFSNDLHLPRSHQGTSAGGCMLPYS